MSHAQHSGDSNLKNRKLKWQAVRVCRGALLLQLLDSYATRYGEMLDGRSEALPVSELAGGARIRHIYQDIFVRGLEAMNPSRCLVAPSSPQTTSHLCFPQHKHSRQLMCNKHGRRQVSYVIPRTMLLAFLRKQNFL